LWTAVLREATRIRAPFDAAWFANQVHDVAAASRRSAIASQTSTLTIDSNQAAAWSQDWGEAPDVVGFLGRLEELATLKQWVLDDRARLVALLGMGGIGKTMLAARLATDLAPAFERVYWRSDRSAPSLSDWLGEAIGFLSDQRRVPPEGQEARLGVLLDLLR
jgi:predicted ribonuclease YlaK